jgi:hypothetical protein
LPTRATRRPWWRAVDRAAALGADALIVADTAVLAYARATTRRLRLHLSVQASATSYEAIEFYRQRYGIQRAVLPRVLTLAAGAAHRSAHTQCRDRGLRLRQPVRDGRGALRAVVVRHRPVAQHRRRVLAAVAVRWEEAAGGVRPGWAAC